MGEADCWCIIIKLRLHLCVLRSEQRKQMTNAIRGLAWCFFPLCARVLLCDGPVYEGDSSLIKHLHSHQSLHAAIHFVAFAVRIRMNGITPIQIICDQIFVAFTFVIRITNK